MKNIYKILTALLLFCTAFSQQAKAQTPNLEFAKISGDGNPTANGPVASTQINFVKNNNNPTGNTFTNYSPTLSATFTLSNQQYSFFTGIGAVALGTNGNPAPIFNPMNIGGAVNSNFTSSGATIGNGFNTTSNYGTYIFLSSYPAHQHNLPRNGRHYYAKLTIDFNRPVDDPILHIAGMGAANGEFGFSMEFNASANVPVELTKLSGTTPFSVIGNQINNSATRMHGNIPGRVGNGSVLVKGKGITSIELGIYLHGDGYLMSGNWYNVTTQGGGDAVVISISTNIESDLAVTKTVNNIAPAVNDEVVFTITATNNGEATDSGVIVQDLLPNGFTYVSSISSVGSYNSATGEWNIGNMVKNETQTLSITAKVNSSGLYTNNATIDGENSDPILSNNTANVTLTPIVCNAGTAQVPLSGTILTNQ